MSYSYREATLNWLALGLLLAAWNASDDSVPAAAKPPQRPEALQGHPHVSVRAATAAAVVRRGFTVL
jgi:pectin methylesterase-like acyl-CoA thioesterase